MSLRQRVGDLEDEVPRWLEGLVSRVRDYLGGGQDAKFEAAEFGLAIPGAHPQQRKALPGPVARSQLEIRIIAEVRSTLMAWLKYPTENMSRLRGTFVRTLLSNVGDSTALLLPGVQEAFKRPRTTILGGGVSISDIRKGDPELLAGFAAALGAMPVTQQDSVEHATLVSLGQMVYEGRESIRRMLHPSLGGRQAKVNIDADELRARISTGVESMVDFLMETYRVLVLGNPPLTEMQTVAISDPDFYSPFRQLAPQVLRVAAPGGFLDPAMIDRPGAIASHWSWRGAFYRSEYSKTPHCKLFFRSAEEWEAHRDRIVNAAAGALPSTYFCEPRAYGTASATRSHLNIPHYFRVEGDWATLLSSRAPGEAQLDYRTAFTFTQELGRLPGIGKLTGMLITSDLVYAGKVKMPTEQELGQLISHLSMGALTAVGQFLELPPSTRLPHALVQEVFVGLYCGVRERLDDGQRAGMQFDPIMFEHALCKLQRLRRRAT